MTLQGDFYMYMYDVHVHRPRVITSRASAQQPNRDQRQLTEKGDAMQSLGMILRARCGRAVPPSHREHTHMVPFASTACSTRPE